MMDKGVTNSSSLIMYSYDRDADQIFRKIGLATERYDASSGNFISVRAKDVGIVVSEKIARRLIARMDVDMKVNRFLASHPGAIIGTKGDYSRDGDALWMIEGDALYELKSFRANCLGEYDISLSTHVNDGSLVPYYYTTAQARSLIHEHAAEITREMIFQLLLPEVFYCGVYNRYLWTDGVDRNQYEMDFYSNAQRSILLCKDRAGHRYRASLITKGFKSSRVDENTEEVTLVYSPFSGKGTGALVGRLHPFRVPDLQSYEKGKFRDVVKVTHEEVVKIALDGIKSCILEDRRRMSEPYEDNEIYDYRVQDEDYSDELGPSCNWPDYD